MNKPWACLSLKHRRLNWPPRWRSFDRLHSSAVHSLCTRINESDKKLTV